MGLFFFFWEYETIKKTIQYAYPTSENAKTLGKYDTGCFYVGSFDPEIWDSSKAPTSANGFTLEGVFDRREDAISHANAMMQDYDYWSLFVSREAIVNG